MTLLDVWLKLKSNKTQKNKKRIKAVRTTNQISGT